ncbi:MAG: hypothetical protein IPP45_11840 [Sphingomonadales bacterium]|nr:hypothetical protein [Sphingomonadales bacterium]
MPSITTGVDGNTILITFSGCDKDGCNYVQLIDYITDASKREADYLILQSSNDEQYSHPLWLDKENYLGFYNYIVIGTDGITAQTLIENMNMFVEK